MQTAVEIFRSIEEILGTYGERQIEVLLGPKELDQDHLLTLRGRGQATREIVRQLRNTLGYNPEDL